MDQPGRAPTSADTVRTYPDADTVPGVRVEYRARARRAQMHLAIADAFNVIARETDRCECGQRGEFTSADTSLGRILNPLALRAW
ncbi:hypothetical protein ACFY3M_13825 [Streptomyces mirabilis]|uniref:hypothetical protein n=1 Tax=Streptomyces mirabilis TaxID=68239 RepID=UPI00368D46D3